ncbi:hypothetical protein M8J75_008051 [Diaphorina citri]|nr:hypothetical protein M8J75_008051 [Diaphorina citri]
MQENYIAQVLTMIASATDTLVSEHAKLLILLAQNPHIQKMVYKEISEVLGNDLTSCPTQEDLMKLTYLDRVLKESLRMCPAVPITARKITEDLKVTTKDGQEYELPAGVNVLIATGFMQNNPEYYENPQVFDPDRWLPENVSKRHPSCYLPFSSGPRNCIGSRYAMFQLKTMAVSILRAFEIMPTKNCKKFEDINVIMSFTIKLSKTCEVTFREREKTLCHHQ